MERFCRTAEREASWKDSLTRKVFAHTGNVHLADVFVQRDGHDTVVGAVAYRASHAPAPSGANHEVVRGRCRARARGTVTQPCQQRTQFGARWRATTRLLVPWPSRAVMHRRIAAASASPPARAPRRSSACAGASAVCDGVRVRRSVARARRHRTERRAPAAVGSQRMEALLLAADVVEEARDVAAARARVAQLPFVAQPLGAHPGAVIPLAASAAPVRTSARLLSSGATTPLRSPASPASPAAPRAPSRASSCATLVDAAQAARAADAARRSRPAKSPSCGRRTTRSKCSCLSTGCQRVFPAALSGREDAPRAGRAHRADGAAGAGVVPERAPAPAEAGAAPDGGGRRRRRRRVGGRLRRGGACVIIVA